MPKQTKSSIRNESPEIRGFGNITLTRISGGKMAVISGNREQPREILRLHAARIDVLSSGVIEVNGFLRRNEKKKAYRKARLVFYGNVSHQKEAL